MTTDNNDTVNQTPIKRTHEPADLFRTATYEEVDGKNPWVRDQESKCDRAQKSVPGTGGKGIEFSPGNNWN